MTVHMPKACEADFADDMHKSGSGTEKKKDRKTGLMHGIATDINS